MIPHPGRVTWPVREAGRRRFQLPDGRMCLRTTAGVLVTCVPPGGRVRVGAKSQAPHFRADAPEHAAQPARWRVAFTCNAETLTLSLPIAGGQVVRLTYRVNEPN